MGKEMGRDQILASLRLILQDFEGGTVESINVVTVSKCGEPSTLNWSGNRRLELLGAMKLSADYCSGLFGAPDKHRTFEVIGDGDE